MKIKNIFKVFINFVLLFILKRVNIIMKISTEANIKVNIKYDFLIFVYLLHNNHSFLIFII